MLRGWTHSFRKKRGTCPPRRSRTCRRPFDNHRLLCRPTTHLGSQNLRRFSNVSYGKNSTSGHTTYWVCARHPRGRRQSVRLHRNRHCQGPLLRVGMLSIPSLHPRHLSSTSIRERTQMALYLRCSKWHNPQHLRLRPLRSRHQARQLPSCPPRRRRRWGRPLEPREPQPYGWKQRQRMSRCKSAGSVIACLYCVKASCVFIGSTTWRT